MRRKFTGLKFSTEDKIEHIIFYVLEVGERPYCCEVYDASRDGAIGSENVGMSNHNHVEITRHRKPEVSLAMAINQGLGEPKANPKGVADGQPVNIPAPQLFIKEMTQSKYLGGLLDFRSRFGGSPRYQIA